MAGTGVVLVLFVCGHMVGNLQFFLGPEAINRYAHFLQSTGELLWVVRLSLLAVVAVHVWSAVHLTLENRKARPMTYTGNPVPTAASYASRTMLVSGIILGTFVVYHLLHYTVRTEAINFTGTDFATLKETTDHGVRSDVFKMMVLGFSKPLVSGFYLVGVGLLCLHLSHGIQAMFQSLGLKSRAWGPVIDRAAPIVAWLLFLGYASIPVSVLLGYGKEVLN
jgi:succinate dehydrogenase / fumarate reductase cytochrome b subunit